MRSMRKKYLCVSLALLFYASLLPWFFRPSAGAEEYYNYRAHNITGDNTGRVQGFSLGSASYTDNGYFGDIVVKGPWVDVRAFGAVTATNVQTVVDCTAIAGKSILIPPGNYTFSGTVTLPNRAIRIIGDNAVINQTGGVPTFLQTNHVYTEISGIRFTGNGNGIKFNTSLTSEMYRDFLIDRCEFAPDAGVYGVYVYGARTGYITNCLFEGGSGIYLQSACLPFVINSTFKGTSVGGVGSGNGIMYDGDGLGTSCGIGIRDSEILGYDNGLVIRYSDWGNISGSTIDYNNNSIRLESTENVTISGGNYIGGSQIYDNAAIWIGQGVGAVGTPDYSDHILIEGNIITGHRESGTAYDAIRVTGGAIDVQIIGNGIHFWNRYGINFDNTTYLKIMGNNINPRGGFGTYSIYNSGAGGDSTVYIGQNNILAGKPIAGISFAHLRDNIGHLSRMCGTQAFDNVTSAVVSHGLALTPNAIQLTGSSTSLGNLWVTNVTSTQFTIHSDNNVSGQIVYWCAEKAQGN